jgi:hypothetical protein
VSHNAFTSPPPPRLASPRLASSHLTSLPHPSIAPPRRLPPPTTSIHTTIHTTISTPQPPRQGAETGYYGEDGQWYENDATQETPAVGYGEGYDESGGYWGEDGQWYDTSGAVGYGEGAYPALEYGGDEYGDDAGTGALVVAEPSGATASEPVEVEAEPEEPEESSVMITVHSAAGLRKADLIGKSDPYVVITVAGTQVAKTEVIDNTQDPEWANATFRVPLTLQPRDLLDDVVLEVYDEDPLGVSDFLGRTVVEPKHLDHALTPELPFEDDGIKLTLDLKDKPRTRRKLAKGTITISIAPTPAAAAAARGIKLGGDEPEEDAVVPGLDLGSLAQVRVARKCCGS